MGSNEGRAWVSLGGVGHVELSEGFFELPVLKHHGVSYQLYKKL